MTGLHAALTALAEQWETSTRGPEEPDMYYGRMLRALLDEHPADLPVATDSTTADVVHLAPGEGSGVLGCCGRTPFEVPRGDRITTIAEESTCTAALIEPSDREPEKVGDGCECWVAPERMWTTHYGAVEPGSQIEFNPECPKCGTAPEPSDRAGLSESERVVVVGAVDAIMCDYGTVADLLTAVERIVADRLAVVEQERAELQASNDRYEVENQKFLRDVMDEQERREAAEQEAATLRAQVAAVEALAEPNGAWKGAKHVRIARRDPRLGYLLDSHPHGQPATNEEATDA